MLSVTQPTNQITTSLPFPGDTISVINFLHTIFNRNVNSGTEQLSKKMIEDWLVNLLELNRIDKKPSTEKTITHETFTQDFSWDYDDSSDFRMK